MKQITDKIPIAIIVQSRVNFNKLRIIFTMHDFYRATTILNYSLVVKSEPEMAGVGHRYNIRLPMNRTLN